MSFRFKMWDVRLIASNFTLDQGIAYVIWVVYDVVTSYETTVESEPRNLLSKLARTAPYCDNESESSNIAEQITPICGSYTIWE